MKFNLGSTLVYTAATPTTLILNVEPQHIGSQSILAEEFSAVPPQPAESYEVSETANRYRRLVLAAGRHEIRYKATVETLPSVVHPTLVDEVPISKLPLEVSNHLFPSRYCESDKLARYAWREFGDLPTGHTRVEAICSWIHDSVDYAPGSSDGGTSAADTFQTRAGVCRDFAHLGITFCRALGIPARFVSAYGWKLEPQDFHAVFEAFLGDRWYLFDATQLVPAHGIIRIGVGRDAADTAFATFFGSLQSEPKNVWVEAVEGNEQPVDAPAVSLSAR